jgi:hypothetical protein
MHYSHELTIAAPIITTPAVLTTLVQMEGRLAISPLPPIPTNLPPDRATADALGIPGLTVQDIRDLYYNIRTRVLDRCPLNLESNDEDSSNPGSKRHDADWSRQVGCYDPWLEDSPMRGIVYTPGTLSGVWKGRVLVRISCVSFYSNVMAQGSK